MDYYLFLLKRSSLFKFEKFPPIISSICAFVTNLPYTFSIATIWLLYGYHMLTKYQLNAVTPPATISGQNDHLRTKHPVRTKSGHFEPKKRILSHNTKPSPSLL